MENLCVWSDVGKLRYGVPLAAVLRSTLTKCMEYCPVSLCSSEKITPPASVQIPRVSL